MATEWHNPDRSLATPIPHNTLHARQEKRRPFWMDPNVYFPAKGELSSDSIHVNHNQPLQVLFAGHIGAKGFVDPRKVDEKDLEDPVLRNRNIRSPSKDDIKRDLRRLDYITRENVDDVINHYLDGSTPSGSSTSSKSRMQFHQVSPLLPKAHWDVHEPPRSTRVNVGKSPPPVRASPKVAKVLTVRRPAHDPASQCQCCKDVNEENARRRQDVSYTFSPSSIRIDYPESPRRSPTLSRNSITPHSPEIPQRSRIDDLQEKLTHQPLSTLIREEPSVVVKPESRLRSDDLYLIYDDNNMRAGWVPLDELQRFEGRKGGRVMYGNTGVAYINYEYPQDQVVVAEDPVIETHRRKLELDVLNSYGKYKNSMNRLDQYIYDLKDWRDSPEHSPIPFPEPRRDIDSGLPQRRPLPPVQSHPDKSVRFSNESPLKFTYTPSSTPQDYASR